MNQENILCDLRNNDMKEREVRIKQMTGFLSGFEVRLEKVNGKIRVDICKL